jgi:hypothetical protein
LVSYYDFGIGFGKAMGVLSMIYRVTDEKLNCERWMQNDINGKNTTTKTA